MRKRCLKAVVAVLAALTLILAFALCASATEPERYGYGMLSENEKYVYDALCDGTNKAEPDTQIPLLEEKGVTKAELERALRVFISDYPECFWVKNNYSYTLRGDAVTAVTPSYAFIGAELDAARDALSLAVAQIMAELPVGSDYEKALYLHDALAAHVEYEMVGEHQTAYGAIADGKAVCAGYAAAYQLLLNEAGIRAMTVTGTSVDPVASESVPHAWNVVWLDDECVYTDVTWDDQGDEAFRYYFNLSASEMAKDHALDAAIFSLPECNHTEKSYFDANDVAFDDTASAADIAPYFDYTKAGVRYAELYYTGEDAAAWLDENKGDLYIALGGGFGSYGYSLSSLGKEVHITMTGNFSKAQHKVSLTPCENISSESDSVQYVDAGNAMQTIVYIADEEYYFPTNYACGSFNGVTVTRISYSQIEISGTPTADVEISLVPPTPKARAAAPSPHFFAMGEDYGYFTGLTADTRYTVVGTDEWHTPSSFQEYIYGLSGGEVIMAYRVAPDEISLDSEPVYVTIERMVAPEGLSTESCTDKENTKGKILYTSCLMEWRAADSDTWQICDSTEIYPLAAGEYFVRTASDGPCLSSEPVSLTVGVYGTLSGVEVQSQVNVKAGYKASLTVTFVPSYAVNKKVTYKSDDERIATVSQSGIVTGVSHGTTYITVTTEEGGFTARCIVVVECSHSSTETVPAKEAQCGTPGHEEYVKCTICDLILSGSDAEITVGHTYGEWQIVKEATETEKGLKKRVCTCGDEQTKELPMITKKSGVDMTLIIGGGVIAVLLVLAFILNPKKNSKDEKKGKKKGKGRGKKKGKNEEAPTTRKKTRKKKGKGAKR